MLTVPGAGSGVEAKVAPFPLTPALSPEERGKLRLQDGKFDAHSFAAVREMFLPLLGGEGRGEGETDVPSTGCVPIVARVGG